MKSLHPRQRGRRFSSYRADFVETSKPMHFGIIESNVTTLCDVGRGWISDLGGRMGQSMSIQKVAFPKVIWQRVLAKTSSTCTYCGKKLNPDEYGKCQPIPPTDGAWEVDHWIPRSSFRDDVRANVFINLWPACCGCNDEKSDRIDGEGYVLERILSKLSVNQKVVDMLVAASTRS